MCNSRPLFPLFAFHCSFVPSASCMSQAPLSLPCVISLHGMIIIISYCITISTTQLFVQSPSPDPIPPIESLGQNFREQSSNHIFLGPWTISAPLLKNSSSLAFLPPCSALSLLSCVITKLSLAWFTTEICTAKFLLLCAISHFSSSKCTIHWSLELLLEHRLAVQT